jgi:hypothetical protein
MKKELLKLLGQLADEAKSFGVYEQYSEAGETLSAASDRVYELTAEIVQLATGKKPTKKELEEVLSVSVGEKGMYDCEDEEE